MKKVEIGFEVDFETKTLIPKSLGRLVVGDGVARVVLQPEDGKVHLYVAKSAEKFIHFYGNMAGMGVIK